VISNTKRVDQAILVNINSPSHLETDESMSAADSSTASDATAETSDGRSAV
jgi:hypothetical protein